MKHHWLALTLIIILAGCQSADKPVTVAKDTTSIQVQQDSTARRQLIIAELKRIRQSLASGKPEQVAAVFGTPVADTSLRLYLEDSSYKKEVQQQHGKITTPIFVKHFTDIAESMQLENFRQLLWQLPLDSLAFTPVLQYADLKQKEPCYFSYTIEVHGTEVILRLDMLSNHNYVSKSSGNDEVPENSSEICEHSLWWTFDFDGKQLHFARLGGAD